MLKRQPGTLFLVTCLILTTAPAVLGAPGTPVVYIAGDGSGDFNCDGKNDHVQINQALQFVAENSGYTTVYLKGPFTYIIDETLLIGSSTILEGDSSAKLKLDSGAGWEAWKPMIKERSYGSHDITIRGFTINGNREGNPDIVSGKGYHNLIHLSNCQDINVCDMYLTNNNGDGLKADGCSNIKFYDNKIYLLGHDALYASTCKGVEAYGNEVTCRTNSAFELYNTNKAVFHDNVITSEGSGGAGIEIRKYGSQAMNDIEVYNNVIYRTALAGIWVCGSGSYSASSANVRIHHNQIYDTGTKSSNGKIGGIVSDGFDGLIENNVIDGAYGAGIAQKNVYFSAPSGSGYILTVKDNIITNTRNGPGVSNALKDTHSFSLRNNCLYGNAAGDYKGVQKSSSDIKADPQYLDRSRHDYHLKSTSPAINIGAFAGTEAIAGTKAIKVESTALTNQTTVNETAVTETMSEQEIEADISSIEGNAVGDDGQAIVNETTLIETAPEQEVEEIKPSMEENAAGSVVDNRLREASPDTVYREKSYLDIGSRPGIGKYRELLMFNLSECRDAENISNATLSLCWYYPDEKERPEDTIVEVYRPAADWNPENVTWNSRDNGVLWTQPGGDWFDKNNLSQGDAPYATITLKASDLPDNRYCELDVTGLVKEYISDKYENTGFLVKTRTEGADYVAFYSSDSENEEQRPTLNVE